MVTPHSNLGKYVSRALTLFFGEGKSFVTIKAAERLIDRALWVAEVVRRKVPDLHQIITISEKKTVDIYEPKEEGLLEVRQERFLTIVEITLTKTPTADEKKAPGYHVPLKEGNFLTKESWEAGEKERAEKRVERGDRTETRGEKREDRPRRENRDRGERNEERGGERRRGRDRRE